MTDFTPERIWIHNIDRTLWSSDSQPDLTEYVRADLDQTDHLNEMLTNICKEHQALMRAAFSLCTSNYPSAHDTLRPLCKDYEPLDEQNPPSC